MTAIGVLDLHGTRFDVGFQHGAAHKGRIRAFLSDDLARLNAILPEKATLESLTPTLRAYGRAIADHLPQLFEEMYGLAVGADITLDQALLLQLRREIAGFQKIRLPARRHFADAGGDCTTLGRITEAGAVVAQTIDLNGRMEPELTVARITLEDEARQVLLLSFTGLLGYLGMNDRGVAIGLNLVLGGEWHPGIPGYMAIRHLLDQASSVDEALALLEALPLASSRALTIADANRVVVVELVAGEMRIIEGREVAHTNHFLHADLLHYDELNPFARTSSARRLTACRHGLANLGENSLPDEYFELFGEAPIYVPAEADIRRECTVASVVLQPQRGKMAVRQGHPVNGPATYLEFS